MNGTQNAKVPCTLKPWVAPYENPIPKLPSICNSTQKCLSIHCIDTETNIHLQQHTSKTLGSQGERRRGINHSELLCCTLCRAYHSDTLYEHKKYTMTDWYQHFIIMWKISPHSHRKTFGSLKIRDVIEKNMCLLFACSLSISHYCWRFVLWVHMCHGSCFWIPQRLWFAPFPSPSSMHLTSLIFLVAITSTTF